MHQIEGGAAPTFRRNPISVAEVNKFFEDNR